MVMSWIVGAYGASFAVAVEYTLEREGVLSDHPDDKGGLTKYGITKPFLSVYLKRPATDQDIRDLTIETAIDAYHELVWQKFRLRDLPPGIAGYLFDCFVNHGGFDEYLQMQLGLKADGVYGPKTIRELKLEIADRGEYSLLEFICDHRIRYYARLVKRDHSQGVFIEGWIDRALDTKGYYRAYTRAHA